MISSATAVAIMTVMSFPWGDVTVAPQSNVDEHCIVRDKEGKITGKFDDGMPIAEGDHLCGCADRFVRPGVYTAGQSIYFCDMWVSDDAPDCWPHEEAHCFGVDDPDAMGYAWPNRLYKMEGN